MSDGIYENRAFDAAVIQFHCNWPAANDPFYLFNTSENQARWSGYGVSGIPTGRIDGVDRGSYSSYEAILAQRLQVSSPLTITLSGTYNSGNRQGRVAAHIVNTSTSTVTGNLHFVLTENGIYYLGGNGVTIHNNTMRDMMPTSSGQSISIPAGGTLDTARTFTLASQLVQDSCCFVVFVQTPTEIAQAAKMFIPPDRPYVAVKSDSVRETSGDMDGRLDPGETANYFVKLGNVNPATATGLTATLSSTDTMVQVLTPGASYPDIPGGATAYNTTPFVVRVRPNCPYGKRVQLTIAITGTGYSVTRKFKVGVGSPPDYIGPDTYGYYVYENLDTRFQQSPPYNWVEINPARGGSGTVITIGDDQTLPQTLPFSMKHYNTASTTLSLCSNGWVTIGSTALTVNSNVELPSSGGAPNMIAAYWCDLDPAAATGGGRVIIYNDATNHRYIVEFDSVQLYTGNRTGAPQTFQFILYDPVYYPTPTGDGEVVLQYRVLNGPVSGTVGIQNFGMSVGTSYYHLVPNPAAYGPANGRAVKFTTVLPTSGVESPPGALQPESPFALYGGWPNPSRGGSTISFSLPAEGRAHLAVYNVAGQLVRMLHDGLLPAGRQSLSWDGRDNLSRTVSGGVYFYRLSFGESTLTQKALILR